MVASPKLCNHACSQLATHYTIIVYWLSKLGQIMDLLKVTYTHELHALGIANLIVAISGYMHFKLCN